MFSNSIHPLGSKAYNICIVTKQLAQNSYRSITRSITRADVTSQPSGIKQAVGSIAKVIRD